MAILSRRQIVLLRDDLVETIRSEQDLLDITDLLEVPRNWASRTDFDESIHTRMKSLLENLNDDPEKLVELLNLLIHREDFYLSKEFLNLMRSSGLDVVGTQKAMKVVLATSRIPEKK